MAEPKKPSRSAGLPKPAERNNAFRNVGVAKTLRGVTARPMLLPRNETPGSIPVLDHRNTPSPWATQDNADAVTEDIGDLGPDRRLSLAERARAVVHNGRTATLSTAFGDPAVPFGFVCNYSVLSDGTPVIAVHWGIAKVGRVGHEIPASLTVEETPLTAIASSIPSAVTVVGKLHAVGKSSENKFLAGHTRIHSGDGVALQRGDAQLFLLKSVAMLVSGVGTEVVRVTFAEYSAAEVDPLSTIAPSLATHFVGDENGSLLLLVRAFCGVPKASSAQLVGIDRFGIDLSARVDSHREAVRLPFQQPVASADDVRRELDTMVRGARFKLGAG